MGWVLKTVPKKRMRRKSNHPKYKAKPVTLSIATPKPNISRNLAVRTPFGNSKTAFFRYVDKIAINTGLSCGTHSFRMNSMFDPDYTGGGHQAMFRDIYSTIYARYRVNYVRYKVTILDNSFLMNFGIIGTQDTGYNPSLEQFQTVIEKRNTNWKTCLLNNEPKVIQGTFNCAKHAGVTKKAYEAERGYSSAIGSNPLLELFFSIFAQDVGLASRTVHFMVELEYNTTYYEPVVQPQN